MGWWHYLIRGITGPAKVGLPPPSAYNPPGDGWLHVRIIDLGSISNGWLKAGD